MVFCGNLKATREEVTFERRNDNIAKAWVKQVSAKKVAHTKAHNFPFHLIGKSRGCSMLACVRIHYHLWQWLFP